MKRRHAAGDMRAAPPALRSTERSSPAWTSGRGGEADEVEQLGRRPLAVQLGEVAEHAAAEPVPGEGGAATVVERFRAAGMAARRCRAGCISGRGRATASTAGERRARARATAAAERRDLRRHEPSTSRITDLEPRGRRRARGRPPQLAPGCARHGPCRRSYWQTR